VCRRVLGGGGGGCHTNEASHKEALMCPTMTVSGVAPSRRGSVEVLGGRLGFRPQGLGYRV